MYNINEKTEENKKIKLLYTFSKGNNLKGQNITIKLTEQYNILYNNWEMMNSINTEHFQHFPSNLYEYKFVNNDYIDGGISKYHTMNTLSELSGNNPVSLLIELNGYGDLYSGIKNNIIKNIENLYNKIREQGIWDEYVLIPTNVGDNNISLNIIDISKNTNQLNPDEIFFKVSIENTIFKTFIQQLDQATTTVPPFYIKNITNTDIKSFFNYGEKNI